MQDDLQSLGSVLEERRAFKARSTWVLSILTVIVCGAFLVLFASPIGVEPESPWPYGMALVVGLVAVWLSRYPRWHDAVLFALGINGTFLMATVHVTVPSGDTALFYSLPLLLFLLFTLPRRYLAALAAIYVLMMGVARWMRPFVEADATSHTIDMVMVVVIGVVIGTFVQRRRVREGSIFIELALSADRSRETADNLRLVAEESAREAHHASQAKSRFLAAMSHELRTPLNAIIGYTGLLKEADVSPEDLQDLERIESAGLHLLALINDVLDLSQVEAGGTSVEVAPIEIDALFEDLGGWLDPKMMQNHNRLYLEVEAGLTLHSDPRLVRQVLINLASNAVRFTERGAITLSAREDRDGIEFEVRDTGIGIAEQHLARIFEPFQQAEESTHRTYGGTGLGLSLVVRFVDVLGGTVRIESEVGEGTLFFIWLPNLNDQGVPVVV